MGAGAGYNLILSDCESVNTVNAINITDIDLEKSDGWCSVRVKGDLCTLDATVSSDSYYYGSGDIENVEVVITEAVLDLGIGNGYNEDILTPEAVEKYEEQFDTDINSLWKELIDVMTIDDVDINYIKNELADGRNFNGSGNLGSGWIHQTFDGTFTLDAMDDRSGYNLIVEATGFIVWDAVTEFIDKAVQGDNVEYTVFWNGDIFETYNTLEEAKAALKKELDDTIAKGDVDSIDFPECQIESSYYYLRNGGESTYEYESDFDNSEIEYSADADPDYEEYV